MPSPDVFISYSHRDKRWWVELETHLKPYLRGGSFISWSDKQIQPGSKWLAEIKLTLASCHTAVLLVSPDFLCSDFIHEQELGPVLKEATRCAVKILWVPIRESAYKKTPLTDYQAVLDPGTPLATMTKARRDKAWVKICEEIEIAVNRPKEPLPEKASGAVARPLALSNLPDRNPYFTGRERVLTQLQEALTAQGRAALSGLGGVGKTQTAVEYAHRHSNEYLYTLWASADSREALVSSYSTVARLLKLPEADRQDQMLAVEAVKHWLSSSQGWLLVLDNADDLGMARAFIPSGKNGHLLLTTRAGALGVVGRRVDIEEMETEEGALLVLRRTKSIAEDAELEVAEATDLATAKEISRQLDGLPLALDQASAYIEESSCGLSGYLRLYREHAPELLRRRGALASEHPDPVATTWALSFENIEKASSAAAELSQAHACAELINQWGFEFPDAARLLNQAGSYLLARGRYTNAEPLYRRALAIWEKALDSEHPEVAMSLNNLAALYYNQGQYANAKPLCVRALAIREKTLGPEHPDLAASSTTLRWSTAT